MCLIPHPKKKRQTAEDYLNFIRSKPCACCLAPAPSDPDHLVTRGAGGSDYFTVPMCRPCHSKRHAGERLWVMDLWRDAAKLIVEFFTKGEA